MDRKNDASLECKIAKEGNIITDDHDSLNLSFGKWNADAKGTQAIETLEKIALLYRPLIFIAALSTLPFGVFAVVMAKMISTIFRF